MTSELKRRFFKLNWTKLIRNWFRVFFFKNQTKIKNLFCTSLPVMLLHAILPGTLIHPPSASCIFTNHCCNVMFIHLMSILDAVCVLLTQPCWSYRPPNVQRSAFVPSQWLRHVRGTACHRMSGMHRRWRRSVASWRPYFFGRRLTLTRRSWLYCTVFVCLRLLTVGDSVILFVFFCLILYGAPAMSLTWSCHLNQYIVNKLVGFQ